MSMIPSHEEDFEYSTPLPQGTGPLRLLTFTSAAASTSLSLSMVDAEQEPRFFAISYAWGRRVCKPSFGLNGSVHCKREAHSDPLWSRPLWTNNQALCNSYLRFHRSCPDGYLDILINGQTFYVQHTVYYLLRTLRASAEIQQRLLEGEYFWLDSICVNQNDKSETKQQTSNMHEIYKAAQHVYVWTGKGCRLSERAMDFLSDFASSESPLEAAPLSPSKSLLPSKSLFWPLYHLFRRPYWNRIWVVQEVLLARDATILCGDRAVPWSKAESLVSQLDRDHEFQKRNPLWTALPALNIIRARKAFLSSDVMPSLKAMIQHFLFSRSTYPEDKLIGLLNVSLTAMPTTFNGELGGVPRRVEVIWEVVRAAQDAGMSSQAAQEWQDFLARLLGVEGTMPSPETLKPRLEHLGFTTGWGPAFCERTTGFAATITPCAGIFHKREVLSPAYAANSCPQIRGGIAEGRRLMSKDTPKIMEK